MRGRVAHAPSKPGTEVSHRTDAYFWTADSPPASIQLRRWFICPSRPLTAPRECLSIGSSTNLEAKLCASDRNGTGLLDLAGEPRPGQFGRIFPLRGFVAPAGGGGG
eukprot:126348-Prorocentrum_minimum.AAC.1